MITLLTIALAGCPTYAAPNAITIDATTYTIQGRPDVDAMAARLERSGCDVAAFLEWRRQIRASRVTAVVGFVVWPAWIATGVHWSNAGRARRRVVAQ